MAIVTVKEGESVDVALRKFKRFCEKLGIIVTAKSQRYHTKPTTLRRQKKLAGIKRDKKRQQRDRGLYRSAAEERRRLAAFSKMRRPYQPRLNVNALIRAKLEGEDK